MQYNNYRPKRSFGQGNIFRSVCQEFCLRGGLQIFGGVSKFSGDSPNFRGGLQFFGGGGSPNFGGWGRNTVNVWPVRILLECILVPSVVDPNLPTDTKFFSKWYFLSLSLKCTSYQDFEKTTTIEWHLNNPVKNNLIWFDFNKLCA